MPRRRRPISEGTRFRIMKRDGFRCRYCGKSASEAKLHIDHVQPVSAGGDDGPLNLVTACEGCNLGKHASLPKWSPCAPPRCVPYSRDDALYLGNPLGQAVSALDLPDTPESVAVRRAAAWRLGETLGAGWGAARCMPEHWRWSWDKQGYRRAYDLPCSEPGSALEVTT